jgi:hypothetical protein
MFNIDLFIFYGVTGPELQSRVLGIDLSVILAMVYVVAWILSVVHAWGAAQPRTVSEPAERAQQLRKPEHRLREHDFP